MTVLSRTTTPGFSADVRTWSNSNVKPNAEDPELLQQTLYVTYPYIPDIHTFDELRQNVKLMSLLPLRYVLTGILLQHKGKWVVLTEQLRSN